MPGAIKFEANLVFEVEGYAVFSPPGKFIDGGDDPVGGPAIIVRLSARRRLSRAPEWPWSDESIRSPPEAAVDQVGTAADVVDVGVGQQQVVDLVGRDGPLAHGLLGFVPLGQAAVDEDGEFVELKQLAGAGDAVFGAEMGNTIVSHRQTQMNTDKMNVYHEGYEEHEETRQKIFTAKVMKNRIYVTRQPTFSISQGWWRYWVYGVLRY